MSEQKEKRINLLIEFCEILNYEGPEALEAKLDKAHSIDTVRDYCRTLELKVTGNKPHFINRIIGECSTYLTVHRKLATRQYERAQ